MNFIWSDYPAGHNRSLGDLRALGSAPIRTTTCGVRARYYLMTIVDKTGQPFSGASSYRLTVRANAPVTQYWSATVYDRATHALIREMKWSSRSSQNPGRQKNADGSVDVAGWNYIVRLYRPRAEILSGTWTFPAAQPVS